MILQIDCGNTRVKWRAIEGNGQSRISGSFASDNVENLKLVSQDFVPKAIQVANVAAAGWTSAIERWALARWRLKPQFAQVRAKHAGVAIASGNVAQLGVDRWLSLLAAYNQRELRSSGVAVISCGTAIVIDAVDARGNHMGGHIAPGISTCVAALRRNTASLTEVALTRELSKIPGDNTEQCVASGIALMVCGMVDLALRQYRQVTDIGIACVTGGDGPQVARLLDQESLHHVEDLPLKGLSYAFDVS